MRGFKRPQSLCRYRGKRTRRKHEDLCSTEGRGEAIMVPSKYIIVLFLAFSVTLSSPGFSQNAESLLQTSETITAVCQSATSKCATRDMEALDDKQVLPLLLENTHMLALKIQQAPGCFTKDGHYMPRGTKCGPIGICNAIGVCCGRDDTSCLRQRR
jgi:hypothetical protein